MSATTMCHLTKFAIAALSSDAKCAEFPQHGSEAAFQFCRHSNLAF